MLHNKYQNIHYFWNGFFCNSYVSSQREYLFPFLWFENWSLKPEILKGIMIQIENIFGVEGGDILKKFGKNSALWQNLSSQEKKIISFTWFTFHHLLQETKRKIITDLQHSTGKISFGTSRRLLLFQNLISLQHAYYQVYDINILNLLLFKYEITFTAYQKTTQTTQRIQKDPYDLL